MRVVLTVSLAFIHCVERTYQEERRLVGPVTNDSQVNLMTKLRRITHDTQHLVPQSDE